MPIFEFGAEGLISAASTSFEGERLRERQDIQRVLRERIEALDPNVMVLAEEFSDWQDSSRRTSASPSMMESIGVLPKRKAPTVSRRRFEVVEVVR
jgi:hypothetical protein